MKKSVPFYEEGHDIICKLSSFFLVNKSVVYDLGCSTGKLTREISEYNKDLQIKIYGIDSEPKMVRHSSKLLNKKTKKRISYKKNELTKINFKKSDLIISYYTIQLLNQNLDKKFLIRFTKV